jgi:hypothetical protein
MDQNINELMKIQKAAMEKQFAKEKLEKAVDKGEVQLKAEHFGKFEQSKPLVDLARRHVSKRVKAEDQEMGG